VGTAISAESRIALPAAGRRKKHMEKRRKKYKIILALGSIICFLLVPFIMIKTEVKADPSFGMVQFFSLIFWPMAGLTLSVFCAMKVPEWRMILLGMTAVWILILNLILPQLPFFLSFLCIIFEGAGYGMIHFWSKI